MQPVELFLLRDCQPGYNEGVDLIARGLVAWMCGNMVGVQSLQLKVVHGGVTNTVKVTPSSSVGDVRRLLR